MFSKHIHYLRAFRNVYRSQHPSKPITVHEIYGNECMLNANQRSGDNRHQSLFICPQIPDKIIMRSSALLIIHKMQIPGHRLLGTLFKICYACLYISTIKCPTAADMLKFG
jgi:hypothetical protein